MCTTSDSAPPIASGPAPPPVGECLTLASTAPDRAPLGTFAARPHIPTGAGVVVLPDLRGLVPFYRDLAVRLAEQGHTAFAIDYYGRTAGPDERDAHFPFMAHAGRLTRVGIQGDLGAAVAWLRDAAGGGCRAVFTLGFCMGGRVSFLASTYHPGLAGTIGFYGTPGVTGPYQDPGPTQLADRLTAPVLALMGGADDGIPLSEVEAFDAALTAAGVEHEVVVYPGAPHGFFDAKQAEFTDACTDAWQRALHFIQRHHHQDRAPSTSPDDPLRPREAGMVVDIRGAVRLDQTLHGERFIRIEFLLAVLLFAALTGWDAVWLLHRHGLRWPAMVVGCGLLVFFLGGAVNYLTLLWLARGSAVAVASADLDHLRAVTWWLAGLLLLPGAVALTAWRQRPTHPPPSISPGDAAP